MNIKTFNDVDTKTPNDEITNGKIMIGVMFQLVRFFSEKSRVQTLANVVHATGGEDRTPRRTHIFRSLVVSRTSEHI